MARMRGVRFMGWIVVALPDTRDYFNLPNRWGRLRGGKMARILTDSQIANLLADPKPILRKQIALLKNKPTLNTRGDWEAKLRITAKSRRTFIVIANHKKKTGD